MEASAGRRSKTALETVDETVEVKIPVAIGNTLEEGGSSHGERRLGALSIDENGGARKRIES